MKKINTTLASLALIFFMSGSSIAGNSSNYSGDVTLTSASKKTVLIKSSASVSEGLIKTLNELKNVLTHINRLADVNNAIEIEHTSLNYLQFNVNDFINISVSENLEMPVENEFDYLRFDVNNFTGNNDAANMEMPVQNFDYLRFDVNSYASANDAELTEMPADNFSYLRFDVNNFSDNSTWELPSAE